MDIQLGRGNKMIEIKGIIPAVITPFDDNQMISELATRKHIENLIEKGVHGIFILGTNGEFHVLSEDEKVEYAKIVIDQVNKRVPVYVGAGACGTIETIRLAKRLEEIGADALSVISPYFIAPTQDELVEHYEMVAKSVSIPIILYNIPKNTGVNIAPETVEKLSIIKNIVGIKDSSGDMENLKGYVETGKTKNVKVLVGSDSKIYEALTLGAVGAIAGTANVITKHDIDLYDAVMNGEIEKAVKLQKDIDVLRGVLKLGTVPSVIKRSVTLLGNDVGDARFPVSKLSVESDYKIKEALKFYNLI